MKMLTQPNIGEGTFWTTSELEFGFVILSIKALFASTP
jgi:hypothetical protein